MAIARKRKPPTPEQKKRIAERSLKFYHEKVKTDADKMQKRREDWHKYASENEEKVKKRWADWYDKNKVVRSIAKGLDLSIPQARAAMAAQGIAPVIYVPASHFGRANYENKNSSADFRR